jgi:hypothetical protein
MIKQKPSLSGWAFAFETHAPLFNCVPNSFHSSPKRAQEVKQVAQCLLPAAMSHTADRQQAQELVAIM